MSKEIKSAEDFLQESFEISHFYDDETDRMVCFSDDVQKAMINFTKMHLPHILQKCYEKSRIRIIPAQEEAYLREEILVSDISDPSENLWIRVDKDSIINDYYLTLIK